MYWVFSETSISTSSPAFLPIKAEAKGERLEILFWKGLASKEPTICTLWLVWVFKLRIETFEPIVISSDFNPVFSISFALDKIDSISKILASIIPCFSLAASYSAFSERSPCSLADLISSITLFLSTLMSWFSSFYRILNSLWLKISSFYLLDSY